MVMIDIAKWLVPILCRAPGLSLQHFPLEQVQTKLQLATNYLKVLEIVEPGLSKFRAKYLFEMIDTKMFLLSKKFSEGNIEPQSFKKELAGETKKHQLTKPQTFTDVKVKQHKGWL